MLALSRLGSVQPLSKLGILKYKERERAGERERLFLLVNPELLGRCRGVKAPASSSEWINYLP